MKHAGAERTPERARPAQALFRQPPRGDSAPRVALVAPLAAQAHRDGDGLRVKLKPPVNFAPTAGCPTGAAIYVISLHGEIGSGTNCILDVVPTDCPPYVTAQFCQAVPVHMTLSFHGGWIEGNVTIFEAWDLRRDLCSRSGVVGNGDAGNPEVPRSRRRKGLRRRPSRLRRRDVPAADPRRVLVITPNDHGD